MLNVATGTRKEALETALLDVVKQKSKALFESESKSGAEEAETSPKSGPKRKHDEMIDIESEGGDGGGQISKRLKEKICSKDEEKICSELQHGSNNSDVNSKIGPGSCGDSDLTAEHHMAESSKSSCFDDACTAPIENVTAAAESASTSDPASKPEEEKESVDPVDLNSPVRIRQEFGSGCEENEREFLSLQNRAAAADDGSKRSSSGDFSCLQESDQKGWLQLGLAGSNEKSGRSDSAEEHDQGYEYQRNLIQGGAGAQQGLPILRLFPVESAQQFMNPPVPAAVQWAGGSSEAFMSGAGGPAMAMARSRMLRGLPEISNGLGEEKGEGFVGFLRGMKPSSESQLLLHAAPNQSDPAAAARPDQHFKNRFNLFTDFIHPPGFEDGSISVLPQPDGLQHRGFGFPGIDSNLGFADFQARARNLQHQANFFPPQVSNNPARMLQRPPINPNMNMSDEWQGIMKRLGSNMHFQSMFGNNNPQKADQNAAAAAAAAAQGFRNQFGGAGSLNPWPKTPAFLGGFSAANLGLNLNPVGHIRQVTDMNPNQNYAAAAAYPPGAQNSSCRAASREKLMLGSSKQTAGLWFILQAAENQCADRCLPQIPKGYLRVKDGTVPVSYVKKYLKQKLGLSCESEVEITCRGQPLVPSLPLQHVRDQIWYACINDKDAHESEATYDAIRTSKNALMVLTYRRHRFPTSEQK